MEAAFLLQKIAEEMGIVFHHEEITVEENRQRNEYLRRYYNPETGEGSDTGDRRILRLPDAPIPVQYIPKALFENEMMAQRLVECGSLAVYAERYGHDKRIATDEAGRNPKLAASGDATEELWREWIRVRIRYDFEFWAFSFVRIKDKLGAEDIPFRLNRPQTAHIGNARRYAHGGKTHSPHLAQSPAMGRFHSRTNLYGMDSAGCTVATGTA